MNTMITWIILIAAAYLLGSVPMSYLAGKSRGIDLRKHGTQQVGGGNLWRTTSRKLGLAVGIYDLLKGMGMVAIGWWQGLDAGQQLVVGLATMVGHNWPLFLKFHGGRGISTLLGIVIILPLLNDISLWPSIIAAGFVALMTIMFRSSPLPVLISVTSLPVTSWIFGAEEPVIMAYLATFLVVVIKRLTAQASPESATIGTGRLLMNRLIWDRDIADRTAWVRRKLDVDKELENDQSADS
jgi:glycerol-3-phosphate acyltransferase PlsY